MWLGVLVFIFVLVVGLMTKWRVHSQVCDQHLAALPSPHDSEVTEAAFGHGAVLFNLSSFYQIFFFWVRRSRRELKAVTKKALPTPVPVTRAAEVLREWNQQVADTFRLQLFGRRCVVTSAPAFARRVLHTHFKLYEKNPKGDSNTQVPPSLAWFIGHDGLFTRPDGKDRTPHASSRIAFAQKLLQALEAPNRVRSAVQRAGTSWRREENGVGIVTLATIQRFAVRCVLEAFLGDAVKLFPTATNSLDELHSIVSKICDEELDAEAETPWRDYWVRVSPRTRGLRKKLHALVEPCVRASYEAALKPRGDASFNVLEEYFRGEIPQLRPETTPAVMNKIRDLFLRNAASELLTAVFKAYMAVAPAVAWVAHYAALPQQHALVRSIRAEAIDAPSTSVRVQREAAGAMEAIQEVLRLHPPLPIVTRTVLHDDMVAVPDLSVPMDKLWHEAAAAQDSVTQTSFAKRSGCVVIPSSCVVVINLDVLLKRTDLFGADAAEFHPRRFLASSSEGDHSPNTAGAAAGGQRNSDPKTWFVTGGFSIGARGCPAMQWTLAVASEMAREMLRGHNLAHRSGSSNEWALVASKL